MSNYWLVISYEDHVRDHGSYSFLYPIYYSKNYDKIIEVQKFYHDRKRFNKGFSYGLYIVEVQDDVDFVIFPLYDCQPSDGDYITDIENWIPTHKIPNEEYKNFENKYDYLSDYGWRVGESDIYIEYENQTIWDVGIGVDLNKSNLDESRHEMFELETYIYISKNIHNGIIIYFEIKDFQSSKILSNIDVGEDLLCYYKDLNNLIRHVKNRFLVKSYNFHSDIFFNIKYKLKQYGFKDKGDLFYFKSELKREETFKMTSIIKYINKLHLQNYNVFIDNIEELEECKNKSTKFMKILSRNNLTNKKMNYYGKYDLTNSENEFRENNEEVYKLSVRCKYYVKICTNMNMFFVIYKEKFENSEYYKCLDNIENKDKFINILKWNINIYDNIEDYTFDILEYEEILYFKGKERIEIKSNLEILNIYKLEIF